MMALHAKDALFCFTTRGFNFATRKTNLNTPDIYPHVFEAKKRKFGDSKILYFTVLRIDCANAASTLNMLICGYKRWNLTSHGIFLPNKLF